jgi:hypothetical protein
MIFDSLTRAHCFSFLYFFFFLSFVSCRPSLLCCDVSSLQFRAVRVCHNDTRDFSFVFDLFDISRREL